MEYLVTREYDEDELMHYGVKGMKWGRRKARPVTGGVSGNKRASNREGAEQKPKKKMSRAKKVAIGAAATAAIIGSAYGTYKLSKYVQNKRNTNAARMAEKYLKENFYKPGGTTGSAAGGKRYQFTNGIGNSVNVGSKGASAMRKHNMGAVSKANEIYRNNTSTKFDRGVGRIVNTGDRIGAAGRNAASKAASTAKSVYSKAGEGARNTVDQASRYVKSKGYGYKSQRDNLIDNGGKWVLNGDTSSGRLTERAKASYSNAKDSYDKAMQEANYKRAMKYLKKSH